MCADIQDESNDMGDTDDGDVESSDDGEIDTHVFIQNSGGSAIFVQTDVSRGADVENLVRTTIEHYGRLDMYEPLSV